MKKFIAGSGGKKDQEKRIPIEADDTLFSKSYAHILDLISEGEIEGLVDGFKSIYLDDTAVTNPNGIDNYPDVRYTQRTGTQAQTFIDGFSQVSSPQSVGQELTYGIPVIRTITDEDISAVDIILSVPQLYRIDVETGDTLGTSVTYKISIQSNGGGYVQKALRSFTGKCTSKFERKSTFSLGGSGPWDIKIERITEDRGSSYADTMVWETLTSIVYAKQSYPNSALVALTFDSGQFRSIPKRAYDMKGLRIQIPSNASVRSDGSLTFSGNWNGTFQTAWTTCPAWIFYDIVTNSRYGLGSFIQSSQIDKWTLYTISQYCNELVNDGEGGTEPRFGCSLYIQSQEEAYSLLSKLASVFRGMTYWAGGQIVPTQDAPADASALFNQSNVLDGLFSYQSSASKARHTVAIVAWNDPEDFYKQKFEYVEDTDGIARYGVLNLQVEAVGCTSRGQANRFGRWMLYTEQHETELVTFKTGYEAATLLPAQVIKIADPMRAGDTMGGRISSATTTTVTVDRDVSVSNTWTLSCLMADGSIEERQIASQAGRVLTVGTAFSSAPQNASVWVLKSPQLEPQIFRVISVKENEGGVYEVSALSHEPSKYDFVEDGLVLQERNYSNLSNTPDAPTNLNLSESLYESQAEVKVRLTFSWNSVQGAVGYLVQYKQDDGNFQFLPETASNSIDILDIQEGFFTCQVLAISALGAKSAISSASLTVVGKTARPSNVQNFTMVPMANLASLSWTKATDLDVLVGGFVRVRHTPKVVDQAWIDAIDILPALAGNTMAATVPLLAGTYMAKFVDSSGNTSETESIIITTIPEALALNVVETFTESPTFAGTKTNCYVYESLGGLALFDGTLIDDLGLIDEVGNFDFPSEIPTNGEYLFFNDLDLGAVYTSHLSIYLDVEALDIGSFIDVRTQPIDEWSDIDGLAVDDVDARVYFRTTLDDPSGSPTWTVWRPFYVSDYAFRAIEFKLVMSSQSIDHNVIVKTLEVTIDMQDRVIQERNLTSGASVYSVVYAEDFRETPSVSVTAQNLGTGDFYLITNSTESGFDIEFKNAGGTTVSRVFDYIAKGYGRKIA